MSCFIVPMVEAVAVAALRKSSNGRRESLTKLEIMLWGGSIFLCAEHLLHGEFGFNFYEMATNGIAMSILVTSIWVFLRKRSIRTISLAVIGIALMVAVDVAFMAL